jgi:hypothetical protein
LGAKEKLSFMAELRKLEICVPHSERDRIVEVTPPHSLTPSLSLSLTLSSSLLTPSLPFSLSSSLVNTYSHPPHTLHTPFLPSFFSLSNFLALSPTYSLTHLHTHQTTRLFKSKEACRNHTTSERTWWFWQRKTAPCCTLCAPSAELAS